MKRSLSALVAVAAMALLSTACFGFPDTPTGNFLGTANAEVGWVNPPYSAGGFWCYKFVNAIGEATIPGWVDAQGPGTFPLADDPNGPQPGDVVTFMEPGQPGATVHVGIVLNVGGTNFSSIEGNSGEAPDQVAINYHPTHGPGPDGLYAARFLLP